jgi:hypothetical protein
LIRCVQKICAGSGVNKSNIHSQTDGKGTYQSTTA